MGGHFRLFGTGLELRSPGLAKLKAVNRPNAKQGVNSFKVNSLLLVSA